MALTEEISGQAMHDCMRKLIPNAGTYENVIGIYLVLD